MGAYAGLCALTSLLNNDKPMVDFSFELFTHVTRFFGYRVVLLGLFNGQKLNNKYEVLVRVTKGKFGWSKVTLTLLNFILHRS